MKIYYKQRISYYFSEVFMPTVGVSRASVHMSPWKTLSDLFTIPSRKPGECKIE